MRTTIDHAICGTYAGQFGDCHVIFKPAQAGDGIVFYYKDRAVPAKLENVCRTKRMISLESNRQRIHIVEHILAAVLIRGITDVRIILDHHTLPSLTHSIKPYLRLLPEKIVKPLKAPKQVYRVVKEDTYQNGGSSISIKPANKLIVDYNINFPAFGHQQFCFVLGETDENLISDARPFTQLPGKVGRLRRNILKKFEARFLFGDLNGFINIPRYDGQEPVRHKPIDFLGALALLGHPVHGHFHLDRSGHPHDIAGLKDFLKRRSMILT